MGYAFSFLISLVVFALDQTTKYLIADRMSLHEVVKITSFFNIVYYWNTGSAFGLFKGAGNFFFIAVSLLAIIVVSVMIIRDRQNRMGLSLILGGATGNLADRIIHGHVIDFLELYAGRFYWPAFNVADSALTVGIGLLLAGTLMRRE